MNLKTRIALSAAVALLGGTASLEAQRPTVKAWLDSTYVVIGMPTTIHLEATVPAGQDIAFPAPGPQGVRAYDDTLQYVLEYAAVPHVDTLSTASGLVTLRQDVEVFAFDSATLLIPPFRFATAGGDTLQTSTLVLKVIVPFDVEPDPQKFFDIKDVLTPGFVLWDYAGWLLWPLGLLLAAAVVAWAVRRWMRRRADVAEAPAPAPALPPHVEALEALEALAAKKLWHNGHAKQFHTELTDILRTYVGRRYGVAAMEMTSDELLGALHGLAEMQQSSLDGLRQILTLADLVKFAKYEPLADEHQLSAAGARMFVTQTQLAEAPQAGAPAPEG